DPAIAQSRGEAGQAVISTNGISCYAEGDHHVSEADFWCWPLPPADTFELTIDWQAVNIPHTSLTLHRPAINAGAERVRQQPQAQRAYHVTPGSRPRARRATHLARALARALAGTSALAGQAARFLRCTRRQSNTPKHPKQSVRMHRLTISPRATHYC